MPMNPPSYDEEDDDELQDGQEPDQQALAAAQLGDSVQQKQKPPQWQPNYAPQEALQQRISQGPPPAPHPSVWQRLGAAALGGAAGFVNTRQGKPGGLKDRLDPSGAEGAVLGTTGYQNKLKQWTQQTSAMEKAAQLQEQQNKDRLTYEEQSERVRDTREGRQQRAATFQQQQQDRDYAQQQQFEGSTYDFNRVPMQPQPSTEVPLTEQNNAPRAMDLPPLPDNVAGDPDTAPNIPQGPSIQQPNAPLPYMGTIPNLPQMAPGWNQRTPPPSMIRKGQPPPPPRFGPDPLVAQNMKEDAAKQAIQQNWHVVTPDEVALLKSTGVPATYQAGQKVDPSEWREVMSDLRKQELPGKAALPPKPAPQTADDLLALRAAGAVTGIPEYDKYTPAEAKAAMASKHPPTNVGVTVPGSAQAPSMSAQQIAHYRLAPPQLRTYKGAMADYDALMTQVHAVNPDYDANLYPVAQDYQSAKRGTTGGNINSLNTVAAHAGDLISDLAALNSGDTRVLNRISNYLGTEFGGDAYSNANLAKEAVVTEIAAALKGAGAPAASEIRTWADSINANSSPQQIQGAKQTLAKLLGRRLDALQSGYTAKFKEPYPNMLPDADAENFLSSAGYNTAHIKNPRAGGGTATTAPAAVSTVNMRAPNGQVKPVPADQVDHYKKLGATVVQ